MRHANRTTTYALVLLGLAGSRGPATGQTTGGDRFTPPPTSSQPAVAAQPTWLRVTANQVNLRCRPDANALVVTRLPRDTLLRAVERDAYGWYRAVPPEGVFSLVSAEYIDRRGPTRGVVSVSSGTLRVRVGSCVADVDPWKSEVQTLLERGAEVEIVGQLEGWYKIVPPPGVCLYVSSDFVLPVSAEVAARLLQDVPTTRPAAALASHEETSPVTNAAQPRLTGTWGRRLVELEGQIAAECEKPPDEQSWTAALTALRPIAVQRAEPATARLAQAWIEKLQQRAADQAAAAEAEDALRRAARVQAQHQREMERIERVRRAALRGFDARGELLRSYAIEPRDGQQWFKLRDPRTQKVTAFVLVDMSAELEPGRYVGRYVGVRGRRQSRPELGAEVLLASEIVVLRQHEPATQPARQEP